MKNRNSILHFKTAFVAGLFLLFVLPIRAQNFSAGFRPLYRPAYSPNLYCNFRGDTDSLSTTKKDTLHSPKKAAIYSAVLPGLGQVYNKKYWKVPVIYVGFGGLIYGFAWHEKYFKEYHNALKVRYDGDTATHDAFEGRLSDNDLVTLKNYYRRYRDLCVIGMAALYTLNILDATVDAYLFYFNVSDKLAMRVEPQVTPTRNGMVGCVGLTIGWR